MYAKKRFFVVVVVNLLETLKFAFSQVCMRRASLHHITLIKILPKDCVHLQNDISEAKDIFKSQTYFYANLQPKLRYLIEYNKNNRLGWLYQHRYSLKNQI